MCHAAGYVFGRRVDRDVLYYAFDVAFEAEEIYAVAAPAHAGVYYDPGGRFAGSLRVPVGIA